MVTALHILIAVIPTARGRFVSGTTDADSARIQWMSRFRMVEVGGIGDLPPVELLNQLREGGVETILLYDWMPAGYHYLYAPDEPFMAWVYANRDSLSLNPSGPFPHCSSYGWCEEYYFDMALDTLREARIEYLSRIMDSLDYDGMFFDWGGGDFIQTDDYTFVRDTYYSRHPDYIYQQAVADFYDSLASRSGKIIITNQGFRSAEYILPVVDFDMTESYAVSEDYFGESLYVEGLGYTAIPRTVYYPVSTTYPDGTIEDQIYYLKMLKDYYRTYSPHGFRGFIYMNYAAPRFVPSGDTLDGYPVYRMEKPKNAIYFGYAIAMLENFMVYTETPFDHSYERDSIYFYDPGEPLDTGAYSPISGVYVRYFDHGIVLAGEVPGTTVITLSSPYIPSGVSVYDPYRGQWLQTGENSIDIPIEPEMDPLTGHMAPFGRLLLYDLQTTEPENHSGDPGKIPLYRYMAGGILFLTDGTLYSPDGRRVSRVFNRKVIKHGAIKPGIYILKSPGRSTKILIR